MLLLSGGMCLPDLTYAYRRRPCGRRSTEVEHGSPMAPVLRHTAGPFGDSSGLASGTTRRRSPKEPLSGRPVLLPPFPEQRKIAAILSSVDDAIAATRKVIEQTKRVKQGLLQTLMTRGIGHTRFKAVPADWVTGKPSGLEEIPNEWEVTRLTDVARLESGHTPARGREDYWGGDVPWVSLHDTDRLARRVIEETAMTIMTEAGLANSSARLLPEGTLVFSRTATVGRCSLLGRPMATSQDFAELRLRPEGPQPLPLPFVPLHESSLEVSLRR